MATDTQILPERYRSPSPIAAGGMGEIYRATDEALGREVAVKVLAERYARDAGLRARFKREALAAARLSGDPYTITIYDVGESEDRPYIVMEYVPGGTVRERMDAGRVEPGQALDWLEQAGAALDAAHAHGVVHRDVKPQNLLLAGDGTVRVADFGIASAAGLTSVTATGTVLGTLGYLAPEQALGQETTPASDRYALAVVAYELLAGRRPWEGAGNAAAEAAAAAREPVPPISSRRGLPPRLDAVFERALAKEPARRYPTCAELVGDLRRAFADDAGATRVAGAPPRRRHGLLLPALLVAAALAAGGLAAGLVLGSGGSGAKEAKPPLSVRTVTARGSTVTVTSVAPPATTSAPPSSTTAATTAPTGGSGVDLNNQGYQLMQAGQYDQALPVLQQAVQKLSGTGSTAEAYALYNLAYTEFALGQCGDVPSLLDQSEQIQGHRKEIDALRKQVKKSC